MTEQRSLTPPQRALNATAWALGWKTCPENPNYLMMLDAALAAADADPDLKRFDLAKVAIGAVEGKVS
jgi:hypothetical protein